MDFFTQNILLYKGNLTRAVKIQGYCPIGPISDDEGAGTCKLW